MRPRNKVPIMMGTAVLAAAALAGCGGSSDAASDGGGGQGAGSGAKGSSALTITEPKDGATVTAPFTLKFTSSEAIGPTESGKDHVHVYLDGKESDYEVVTSTEYQVKDVSAGKHTIDVALQHADHSPVGPKQQITVTVNGGSGGGGGDTGGGGGGGGGGYDYGNGGNGGY